MTFVAPIWLFGLLPWAVLTIWLLWGRRTTAAVPFVALWRGPVVGPRAKRSVRLPPLALALLILAVLLAILSAAGPVIPPGHPSVPTPTVIVDRGMTMSARGSSGIRFRSATRDAAGEMLHDWGDGPIDVVVLPAGQAEAADRARFADRIAAEPLTAANTAAELRASVAGPLAHGTGPVIVISDRVLDRSDPRLIQVAPDSPVEDVGIAALSMRVAPKPQLMVKVLNQSDKQDVVLRIETAGRAIDRPIHLPPRGQAQNEFIDVLDPGPVVSVKIEGIDDLPADDQAWLVRGESWPVIEARSVLPAELQRVIEIYDRRRLATESSAQVGVFAAPAELPGSEPAILTATRGSGASLSGTPQLSVAYSPITDGISFDAALKDAIIVDPPADGWSPLLSLNGKPIIAMRTAPARQVWVGLWSNQWTRSVDFVLFWTKTFDWVGQGSDTYSAQPIESLAAGWQPVEGGASGAGAGLWPGLYRSRDGRLRAVNAPAMAFDRVAPTDWREAIRRYPVATSSAPARLSHLGLLLALVCIAVAAMLWRLDIHTPFPPRNEAPNRASSAEVA